MARNHRHQAVVILPIDKLPALTTSANITSPQNNNAYNIPSVAALIRYIHASASFPVKYTWLADIKASNYVSWPGLTHTHTHKNNVLTQTIKSKGKWYRLVTMHHPLRTCSHSLIYHSRTHPPLWITANFGGTNKQTINGQHGAPPHPISQF